MASIQKRGKTWQYRISHTKNGEREQISKGGFKTKKEAQVAAAELEASLSIGLSLYSKTNFYNYFKTWKEIYKDPFISSSTRSHYMKTLEEIGTNFGMDCSLQDVTKDDYQKFITNYGETHSKESVIKINSRIRACVQNAVEDGLIRVDFTRKVKIHYAVPAKKEEDKFLHYHEAEKLIHYAYSNLNKSHAYYMIIIAISCGLRFSEIVALTHKDFDFKNNTISINKTWQYMKRTGCGFAPTKNASSTRTIKADKKLMRVFKEFLIRSIPNEYDLIFYTPDTNYNVLSNTAVNKLLRGACRRLGILEVTMHALRHTHASILLYKKVSIQYVSERLGHSDITTTLGIYTHVLKELREYDETLAVNVFEGIQ